MPWDDGGVKYLATLVAHDQHRAPVLVGVGEEGLERHAVTTEAVQLTPSVVSVPRRARGHHLGVGVGVEVAQEGMGWDGGKKERRR